LVAAVLLAVFFLLNIVTGGALITANNLRTIFVHSIFHALTAWGLCFIFTTGLCDLSIGAIVLLAANVGGQLGENLGLGYPGMVIGSVAVAIICEHLCTRCSIQLGIPSWVSGLGCALIFEAILSIWANAIAGAGRQLPHIKVYRAFGKFPVMMSVWVAGLAAAYLIYNYTDIGLNLRAVGANENVATAMGIKKRQTIYVATLVGAVFVGIAATVQISYSGFLSAKTGLGSLSSIFKGLATLLLANSFEDTFSMPVGIAIGAIVVMGIFNVLTVMGVPSGTGQEMCLGAIVILCGALSHLHYKGVVK
jgi:ribose transport system permease protein